MEPVRVAISHHDRLAVLADGDLQRQLGDVGFDVFLALPSLHVETLAEVSLLVKQAHADERNAEVRRALDVVAGQDAEAAGIDGQRLMQAELGGEVGHRPGPQHAGVLRAPGLVGAQILLLAAVAIIDAAVEHQFGGAPLQLLGGNLAEQGDGILIELRPAGRIQIAKQADAIRVPAPPDIVGERPEAFLGGRDEALEGARLADDRRHLVGRFDQHANVVVAKGARLLGLNDEHSLQHAAIDDRHSEKGVECILFGIFNEFEARDGSGRRRPLRASPVPRPGR